MLQRKQSGRVWDATGGRAPIPLPPACTHTAIDHVGLPNLDTFYYTVSKASPIFETVNVTTHLIRKVFSVLGRAGPNTSFPEFSVSRESSNPAPDNSHCLSFSLR